MPDETAPTPVQIPDFVIKQMGVLQIQLALAQAQNEELTAELAVLKATMPNTVESRAGES